MISPPPPPDLFNIIVVYWLNGEQRLGIPSKQKGYNLDWLLSSGDNRTVAFMFKFDCLIGMKPPT